MTNSAKLLGALLAAGVSFAASVAAAAPGLPTPACGDDEKKKESVSALCGDDEKKKESVLALCGDDEKKKESILAL